MVVVVDSIKKNPATECVFGGAHNNRCELFVFIVRLKLVLDCFRATDYGHTDPHFIRTPNAGFGKWRCSIWGAKENGGDILKCFVMYIDK